MAPPMNDTDIQWFVAQTRVNGEEKARFNLERQGYTVYLPRYQKRRRHARRVDIVLRPLYPRYLFVGFDAQTKGWRAINSTLGVSRIVSVGEAPAQVGADIIEAIRRSENHDGLVELDPLSTLKTGDRIEVVEGAFTSRLGLYEGLSDNQRVSILLDILGRKVRVALDRTAIDLAET